MCALSISLDSLPEFDTIADGGSVTLRHASLILDSSYPAGGYPCTPSRFGFSARLFDIIIPGLGLKKKAYGANFDTLNNTVRIFAVPVTPGGSWYEITPSTNLSGIVLKATAIGF